jgi:hypothetical protein
MPGSRLKKFLLVRQTNTPQGRVSELRTTAQNSRFSFKVTDKFAGNDVLGYLETDFSGNDAPSVYQTSNPHTSRLRLYFMDLKRGKWEVLGGQTWGWLTPNRGWSVRSWQRLSPRLPRGFANLP